MIDFQSVTQQFGAEVILRAVSFRIHSGERVGIVGPNGAGKSTLFGLLCGELEPQGGVVNLPRQLRWGYLRQQLAPPDRAVGLLDYAATQPRLTALQAEMQALEQASADMSHRVERLGELEHTFEDLGGYTIRARAAAALSGLGFAEADFARPLNQFSGGWQMRAELVRTVVDQPDLLLLDEPSNYLDLPAVEWLQRFLRDFAGTLLLISHDRYLLRALTNRTLEVWGGAVTKYPGGFDAYQRERALRHAQQAAAHQAYLERRAQLERFINRFRAQATKAAQVQSRVKMLEKMEATPPPPRLPDLSHLRIAPPPRCGAHPLRLEQAGASYDGRRWIFRHVDLEIQRGEKVALVGFNGYGKTTLLRTLAGVLPLREGRRLPGHDVIIGYQSQDFAETMPPDDSVAEILKAAHPEAGPRAVRSLAGAFGFSGAAADKPCGVLSGGEKIRLAFARLFIRPPNLLLLDEPTTHLDLYGREALERALVAYAGTVCVVSHDVAFIRRLATRVVALTPPGITEYAGGYDYYLEKSAQASAASGPAAPAARNPDPESALPTAARGKAARQARAQARAAAAGLRQLERDLAALEQEKQVLETQLAQPPDDLTAFADLGRRHTQLVASLERLEEQWLIAAHEE